MQCCECDKHFYVSKDVEVTYSTSKTCEKNGLEHDWNEIQHHEYKGKDLSYRTCKICRQHDSLTPRDENG